MREILFFEPIFKEKIWGGNRLKTTYEMDIPSHNTGECWAVSGHSQGESTIKKGTFDGWTLSELWNKKRDLFGNIEGAQFPLLVKIIDACDDLSIQVHPDNIYSWSKDNNIQPKTECWYVLDCEDGAQIIFGHTAKTLEELKQMISDNNWERLLQSKPVKKCDFIYVPSGTIHALKKGSLILEIQQPSDTTYRLYDYERLENGSPRELHIEEALKVIKVPHNPAEQAHIVEKNDHITKSTLAETPYFSVYKFDINGSIHLHQDKPFIIICVVEGNGIVDGIFIKKGDFFMLPSGYGTYNLEGKMTLILSTKDNNIT